jgi:hypothetical protein
MGTSEFQSNVQDSLPQDLQGNAKAQSATTPSVHAADVLTGLCVLLEQYAPVWYSEDLRHRVLKAMRLPTEVLVELCALLEDHAPTWYTEYQRERALGVLQTLGILESETLEGLK